MTSALQGETGQCDHDAVSGVLSQPHRKLQSRDPTRQGWCRGFFTSLQNFGD
jgi:hypothetical protein